MIDCKVNVARKADPKGDRVVLTFEYVSRRALMLDPGCSAACYGFLVENSYPIPSGNKG